MSAFRAGRLTGRSPFAILREVVKLRRPPNRISPDEYFAFKLYNKSPAEQRDFLGAYWNGPINYMVSSPSCFGLVRDKLNFQLFFDSQGLPVPPIAAVYSPEGRQYPGARQLRSAKDIEAFLSGCQEAVFAKPIAADVGIGVNLYTPRQDQSGRLTNGEGKTLSSGEIAENIAAMPFGGFLFQEVQENGDELAELFGRTLLTFRLKVTRGKTESKLHRGILKIKRDTNPSDNWNLGRNGNGVGAIDPATGVIEAALLGPYPDCEFVDTHPDSGLKLSGLAIPGWSEMAELCLKASRLLPGLGIGHWDAALTRTGPMLIEVNEDASMLATQLCGWKGFWDDDMRAFLAEFGLDLDDPATIALAEQSGGLMSTTFGRDNALLGRGTLLDPIYYMR